MPVCMRACPRARVPAHLHAYVHARLRAHMHAALAEGQVLVSSIYKAAHDYLKLQPQETP